MPAESISTRATVSSMTIRRVPAGMAVGAMWSHPATPTRSASPNVRDASDSETPTRSGPIPSARTIHCGGPVSTTAAVSRSVSLLGEAVSPWSRSAEEQASSAAATRHLTSTRIIGRAGFDHDPPCRTRRISTHLFLREVPLLSHRVRLRHPRPKLGVDVVECLQAKDVDMVARRKRLHRAKTRTLESASEDDVPVEPPLPRRHLSKGHANVEGDSRLFRENLDRAKDTNRGDNGVEQRP